MGRRAGRWVQVTSVLVPCCLLLLIYPALAGGSGEAGVAVVADRCSGDLGDDATAWGTEDANRVWLLSRRAEVRADGACPWCGHPP